MRVSKFWSDFRNGRYREPARRSDWLDNETFTKVVLVNAFYSSSSNAFVFPAGFLRGHFFNPGVPKYMNFAGVGGVIGHEISHGFDDQGRQTDGKGERRRGWERRQGCHFEKRTKAKGKGSGETVRVFIQKKKRRGKRQGSLKRRLVGKSQGCHLKRT